jgi:hypothetical protein
LLLSVVVLRLFGIGCKQEQNLSAQASCLCGSILREFGLEKIKVHLSADL